MTTEQDSASVEERVRDLLHSDDVESAREVLLAMHPADQADLFDRLDEDERQTMLSLLDADGVAALLEHMDEDVRKEVAEKTPRGALAQILDRMENDIAVDILHDMAPAEASLTLAHMRTAAEILPLMQHSDETAGGIMTRGYIALHKDMTAEEALAFLRATKPLAEEAYYLYVLDGQNHLQGIVSLRQLVVSEPQTRLEDVMVTDVVSVAPDTDQEEAARLLQRYRLRSLPVVDADGMLSGIITADDIIDVIQEEATEDMYRMVGVGADESALAPVRQSLRRRVPWLVVNLMTAFLSALTVSLFQGTIERVSTLAAFMPVIAGHGGNTGTQVTTLVVRGLALDEVEVKDAATIVAKEIAFGIVHGALVGALTAGLAYLLSGNYWLSIVVFAAMVGNVLVAGIMGALIPLGMRTVKIDPALASAIWLTTFTDVAGFLMLLGTGALLVSKLQ
jgi:magnesium transporter